MLVVKQVEGASGEKLIYECHEAGRCVGRLTAQMRPGGMLEAQFREISHPEAARVLAAKLERDAVAHGLAGLYLWPRHEKERNSFLGAGYEPTDPHTLQLFKRLGVN